MIVSLIKKEKFEKISNHSICKKIHIVIQHTIYNIKAAKPHSAIQFRFIREKLYVFAHWYC